MKTASVAGTGGCLASDAGERIDALIAFVLAQLIAEIGVAARGEMESGPMIPGVVGFDIAQR